MEHEPSAQNEIIRFAIQCRLVTTGNRDGLYMDALTKFAKLVAAKEREAIEKLFEELSNNTEPHKDYEDYDDGWVDGCYACKLAVTARGEQAVTLCHGSNEYGQAIEAELKEKNNA
jgi:hypothetical protein